MKWPLGGLPDEFCRIMSIVREVHLINCIDAQFLLKL